MGYAVDKSIRLDDGGEKGLHLHLAEPAAEQKRRTTLSDYANVFYREGGTNTHHADEI